MPHRESDRNRIGHETISVCMATHNGEKFIRQQLASILCLLGSEDEIVISDDSSDDKTIDIIEEFADERIKLHKHNQFFNPIFNFENALRHARGDIVVLSDQDDVWMDGKIRLIRDSFNRNSAAIHLVVLNGVVIDTSGVLDEQDLFAKLGVGKGLLKNIFDNTYMGCCMAFSRSLLQVALPFPQRIPMHDMWLGLLGELLGNVEFIDEPTIFYRKHPGNFTDFRRRFRPLQQIRWRFFLVWSLTARYLACKVRQWKAADA